MSARHIFYAILIALIWGSNFTAIKLSYASFQPFFLLFTRFFLSAVPFIFFVPRPKASWREVFLIAFFLWIAQFSFLFVGMYLGAQAGLTSIILQSQTIFTMILSVLILAYRPLLGEVVGMAIAALGMVGIGWARYEGGSMIGILTIIPAAFCVSVSNILFAKGSAHNDHPLTMIVWTSFIASPVMLAASLILEGPESIMHTLENLTLLSISSTAYTIYLSTLVATSLWAYLLQQYPPSTVVPFTLLIPVFGMAVANQVLDEIYPSKILGMSCIVLLGLAINQWLRRQPPKMPLRKIT